MCLSLSLFLSFSFSVSLSLTLSAEHVFAAGDCCHMKYSPRPKVGKGKQDKQRRYNEGKEVTGRNKKCR
jgi:hypothetical protein